MNYKLDKSEEALIEKYGFKLDEQGDRFVITDPQLPRGKNRYIGGNLFVLIYQAIDNRNKINNPMRSIHLVPFEDMLPNLHSRPKAKITNLQKLQDQPEAEIVPMKPNSKPEPKKGTLYTIKKILVEKPDITYEEIVSKLKEAGLNASESSIKTCRSDLRHTIKVIKELGRWKDC